MNKKTKQPWVLQLFGGLITISGSDMYKFYIRMGPFIFCMATKQLDRTFKENRRNT